MPKSVRDTLSCIGAQNSGKVSVLRDLFGFLRARVPTDPVETARVRLLQFMQDLQGKHVHVNIIRVGIDNFGDPEVEKIDYCIYRCRTIFRPQSLTLGRVLHFDITSAEANGRDDIGSAGEATDLTHEWSVDNDGMDVFIVDNISAGFVGISNIEGPCNKDAIGRNGAIGGEVSRGFEKMARTFAHEIGHYLGLTHVNDGDRLMAQTKKADDIRTSVLLTDTEGKDLRKHCFVRNGR